MSNNYTLGRGEIHFARFQSGTKTPDGFRYIGNTPEFNMTIEDEQLDHYNSDAGVREKDDSMSLEVNRSGSLITDNISPENVALFFFGAASTVTQSAASAEEDTFSDIKAGHSYKLGSTTSNPAGYFGIDEGGTITVEDDESTPNTLTEGTDFEIDYDNGIITFLEGSTLAVDGANITVTYDVAGSTRERVLSGNQPVEGAMMYKTKNPKGTDSLFYLPWVKVRPNGDYALKGDDWQQIPLTIEILKPTDQEAIYRDGKPVLS